MHRVLAATLSLVLLAGMSVSTASAATKSAGVSAAGSNASAATKSAAPASQPTAVTVASRLSSMVVGSAVGVPICMARRSQEETVIATKELVGDTKHKWLYVAAAPLGLMGGVVSGVFQAIVFAPYHAYKYSDQPFSKEVFSLGSEK